MFLVALFFGTVVWIIIQLNVWYYSLSPEERKRLKDDDDWAGHFGRAYYCRLNMTEPWEELEHWRATARRHKAENDNLRALNAELLAALETFLRVRQTVHWDDVDMENAEDIARAAIAKAKDDTAPTIGQSKEGNMGPFLKFPPPHCIPGKEHGVHAGYDAGGELIYIGIEDMKMHKAVLDKIEREYDKCFANRGV